MSSVQLLTAASNLAQQSGAISDVSAKDFLDQFPLPDVLKAIGRDPGKESVLVECLEKIFRTNYGASLIPKNMKFIEHCFMEHYQKVRRLASICISRMLATGDRKAAEELVRKNVYTLLLNNVIDGDEHAAAASIDVIVELAIYQSGWSIVFPAKTESTNLAQVAEKCSSLVQLRFLALIAKLFSMARKVALEIQRSNSLTILEEALSNTNDSQDKLKVLKVIYEMAQAEYSAEFLSKTTLLPVLISIISNGDGESILRSWAMKIAGMLLSKENVFAFIAASRVQRLLSVIDKRYEFLESPFERECVLRALGEIGAAFEGAEIILSNESPIGRHVVNAAFGQQQSPYWLVSLHSLAKIAGETRTENVVLLNSEAEGNLERLIREQASKNPNLTPSGFILSLLQQQDDVRIAGFRLISGLIARPWCLSEISKATEIIELVTDTTVEINESVMEVRHKCCKTVLGAIKYTLRAYSAIVPKLEEAIKDKEVTEAQSLTFLV